MTVGRRQYNEAEMLQMQREAEDRVREMQDRARRTVENNRHDPSQQNQRQRGWNTNTGTSRQRNMRWPGPYQNQNQHQRQHTHEPAPSPLHEPAAHDPAAHLRPDEPAKKDGTIIGDIMDALGLDEDYLLIIGLILILINQRADTTLILALAYLLI